VNGLPLAVFFEMPMKAAVESGCKTGTLWDRPFSVHENLAVRKADAVWARLVFL